jgi:hypothetical protein
MRKYLKCLIKTEKYEYTLESFDGIALGQTENDNVNRMITICDQTRYLD